MTKPSLLVILASLTFAGCALDDASATGDVAATDVAGAPDDPAALDRDPSLPALDEADVLAPESARACGYSVNKLGSAYWKNCTAGKQLIHVDIRLAADKYKCVQPSSEAFLVGSWGARGATVVGTTCR